MNMQTYDRSKNLGGFYPYYCSSIRSEKRLHQNLSSLLSEEECRTVLDEHAVLQVLNRYFMFGDRTIFRDIKRVPWMAKTESQNGEWEFHNVPQHGISVDSTESEISGTLFKLLCKEIKIYTGNHRRIGILLSGGMDSRIVAGVLNFLIQNKEIAAESVTAYTWGVEDSRDVVYSGRIADLFGWKWKHFRVEAEHLWQNFKIAGERGCEYTGLHLHAIPRISEQIDSEVDVMLAGSYGDSVGRAEYSGSKVTNLAPIQGNFRNPFSLIKSSVYQKIKDGWMQDIESYHKRFPREKEYQQFELDYQLHYMRRMLNPCMELINDKVEMYQAFTHPDVFGYMWSLHPKLRNDDVYKHLLKRLNPDLLTIPWARTGLRYPLKEGVPDEFKKKHHKYSKFMQVDLMDKIESRLTGHNAIRSGIINEDAVKAILSLVKTKKDFNFDYLEKLAWLISYTYLCDKYEIEIENSAKKNFSDQLNAGFKVPLEYGVRHLYRKARKLF